MVSKKQVGSFFAFHHLMFVTPPFFQQTCQIHYRMVSASLGSFAFTGTSFWLPKFCFFPPKIPSISHHDTIHSWFTKDGEHMASTSHGKPSVQLWSTEVRKKNLVVEKRTDRCFLFFGGVIYVCLLFSFSLEKNQRWYW